MAVTLKEVKQLEAQELLGKLLIMVDCLYKSTDYIGFTKEQFYQLVLEEIDKSKKMYNGGISYREYLRQQLVLSLNAYVKSALLEPEKALAILNHYINSHFKKRFTYEKAVYNLKQLDSFFELHDYLPEPYVLLRILEENGLLLIMVKFIVEKHMPQITSGHLEKIFVNKTIILMVEIYCMLNNVEFKNNKDLKAENDELTDFMKEYLEEIRSNDLLLPDEEKVLAQKMLDGDSIARKRFIESHLHLVVGVANKYVGRGLSLGDLIQEGNLGLIMAVDKYNANNAFDFANYATFWIRNLIIKAIVDKVRNIRIPTHVYEKVDLYQKTIVNLQMRLNREPSLEEIAAEMDLAVSEVIRLHRLRFDTVSISSMDSEDTALWSLDGNPEDIIKADDMTFQIQQLLEECKLNGREKEVLWLRYGKNMTLEEIGKKFGITREAVRQTEKRILRKLKDTQYMKEYTSYIFNQEEPSVSESLEQPFDTDISISPMVDKIEYSDVRRMLEIFKQPSFTEMMSIGSVKVAIIVFLTAGYLDGKCFSPLAISEFMGITEQMVREIFKSKGPVYKERIDRAIDEALKEAERQSYYMRFRGRKF